jgi:Helix-turn-helix domain
MMSGEADIAAVAALLADPTRATMLLTLSDGRAFTASELAKSAKVAPSTASEHLSRLLDNRHFTGIDELEDVQLARCVALQSRPDLIRSTTRFHWWPKQIHKRRGPRRRACERGIGTRAG